jgi:diguanylate cyclase (GGDEF)-like protein
VNRRRVGDAGLVDELQSSHRFTVGVLVSVLLVSLLTSGYLIAFSQPRIIGYVELARQARDLREAMLDQETGLRGWLATGDSDFLDPYRQGRSAARTAAAELVGDLPARQELASPVVATLMAREDWEAWATRASHSTLTRRARVDGTLSRLLSEGKVLFDEFRVADRRSTDLIRSRRQRALRQQTTALVVVLVIYVLGVAGTGAATARRRRRLGRALLEPLDDLHETIAELRAGNLSARARHTSVPELGEIGVELGRLADDLARAGREATAREQVLALAASRFETLVRVGREIAGSLSVRYVAGTVVDAASDLLQAGTRLWVPDPEQVFRVVDPRPDGYVSPLALLDPPEVVIRVATDATPCSSGGSRAYPLVLAGRVTAVLEADTDAADHTTEQVLTALLATAAAALESAHLHSAARAQADQDALTLLFNRRRFDTDVDAEWERSRRYGRPLSIVMLDLDHFKGLNDQHGHLVGDHALREAAQAIASGLRSTDSAYRFGGEEFVVLLRETGLEAAEVLADRLREAVRDVTVPGHPDVALSTSAGVAARRSSMSHYGDLVAEADRALYEAKRLGRDRVAVLS